LRAAVAAGTKVGKEAREYMGSERLVPDEVIIGVVIVESLPCKHYLL
jgi:adenylate kinase family enzyme